MYNSQRYVAVIAGPSLAGLVVALLGSAACYAVDAISWLVMLGFLSLMRSPIPDGERTESDFPRLPPRGWRFVLGHAVIFPVAGDGLRR